MTVKEIKIGIIGFGTVGAGVAANILANSDVIASRAGVKLVLAKVADLDITTDRGVRIPEGVLTTDAAEAIREADIVVELVGGTTVAKKFILDAIRAGKPVVTANKALLALHGEEIFSRVIAIAQYAREEINAIGDYDAFSRELIDGDSVFDFDVTKLSVNTLAVGLAGIEVIIS